MNLPTDRDRERRTETIREHGLNVPFPVKKLCQKWDLNPRPHTRTRTLALLCREGCPWVWRLRPLGHPDSYVVALGKPVTFSSLRVTSALGSAQPRCLESRGELTRKFLQACHDDLRADFFLQRSRTPRKTRKKYLQLLRFTYGHKKPDFWGSRIKFQVVRSPFRWLFLTLH